MKPTKQCSVDGCASTSRARGYCNRHYLRAIRHGDPTAGRDVYSSPEDAFKARTRWRGDCLEWTGSHNGAGYGEIRVNYKLIYAHRYAWERVNGPIPEGMVIDHICMNPKCVNMMHLRTATASQNNSHLPGAQPNSTSQVRNVHRSGNRWMVKVGRNGEYHNFGTYDTVKEAAKVAEAARKELFGEFAGRG